ncbi:MAG: hypothetical protein ACM3XS_05120 [Bacteroidota bacterium]
MSKIMIYLVLVVLAIGVLASTNPDRDDFVAWQKGRIESGARDPLSRLGAALAAPALAAATTVQDYGVCSVFQTKLPRETRVHLGILGGFIRVR